MNPSRDIGSSELLALASGRPAPTLGLIDGPVDTSHPAFAEARVHTVDGQTPACIDPRSPACRHGTFVAGQLLRQSPRSELVTHSLFCEASSLHACPVVGPRHLAIAIEALIDRGARIINMSVGLQGEAPGSMASLHRAYHRARRQGVLLVAAAGNDGQNDVNPLFRDEWVIPVAAHDRQGTILPSSNRGGLVASHGLLAPGVELAGPAAAGDTTQMQGTSVAAPLVTAAAALLWSLHPDAGAEQIRRALLRPDQARHAELPPLLDLDDSHAWLTRQPSLARTTTSRSTMSQLVTPSAIVSPSALLASRLVPSAKVFAPPAGVVPQACGCGQGAGLGFVYSTGQVEVRFPDEGTRQEYSTRASQMGVNPTNAYAVLSDPKNRYLARRVCWVLQVADAPAGILVPRSEAELSDLIAALDVRPNPLVAVTGTLGPAAPASKCDGLQVPTVGVVELSYFTQDKLLEQLAKETGIDARSLASVADPIWTLTGVWRAAGFDDEQRAKNFVVLRTTTLYEKAVELGQGARPYWLQAIGATPESSEAGRRLVDVDSTFQNGQGQTQTWRAQVDVTDLFAFSSKALFQA